jgi:hypothetical protein
MIVTTAIAKINKIAKVEVGLGRFAIFGSSDVTCALLAVGDPMGKFQ